MKTKISDLLFLGAGAVAIYFLWPKKAGGSYPTTVAPSAAAGSTSQIAPTFTAGTPSTASTLPDTSYEPSYYEQQAAMSPDDLASSILTQGLNGYDGGKGPAFAGGWWR